MKIQIIVFFVGLTLSAMLFFLLWHILTPSPAIVKTFLGADETLKSKKYNITIDKNESFIYQTNAFNRTGGADTASWTSFEFSGGSVVVTVGKIDETPIESVIIRPLNLNIKPIIKDDKVEFTLAKPCKISVEFNNDLTDKCFIFADAPEVDIPNTDASNVLYFGPGVHDIGEKNSLPLNKDTIYLAGGAYVKGSFYINIHNRDNITVKGRGILSGEDIEHRDLDGMLRFYDTVIENGYHSNSITIDGITMIDSFSFNIDLYGQSRNTPDNPHIINNVKMISWAYNTDGYHTPGYNKVNDLFIFNSDDAIDAGQFTLGSEVTNCILWQNRSGSSILFSWVGTEDTGNTLIDNIDIIHFDEDELTWENNYVFMAHHGEGGNINNITISNVRVESFGGINKRVLGLRVKKSFWSNPDTPYGSLSNIYFKNIQIDEPTTDNVILGYSGEHNIQDLVFENLSIAGKNILSKEDANIRINKNVKNIIFLDKNYIENGSFENNGQPSSKHWKSKNEFVVKTEFTQNKAYSGWYFGEIEHSTTSKSDIFQEIKLPNGRYTLYAYAKSSAELDESTFVYVENYGGSKLTQRIEQSEKYKAIVITDIVVANGTCKIGVFSEASNETVISFDNFILQRQIVDETSEY
jgi:hypothetical protein